ncbi:MAG: hypothetical protein Q9183_006297, partial [Haloplaca sp. 2 TL-2023]
APLLLPLFALIPSTIFSFISALLYSLADILCANSLIHIAESGAARESHLFSSPRKGIKWSSIGVGAA